MMSMGGVVMTAGSGIGGAPRAVTGWCLGRALLVWERISPEPTWRIASRMESGGLRQWWQSNRASSHGQRISDEDGDVYRRRLRSGYPSLSCIYLGSWESAGLRVGHELAKKGKDVGTMPAAFFCVLIFDLDALIVGHRAITIDPWRVQRGPREEREAV
jgi:hypothetical protein